MKTRNSRNEKIKTIVVSNTFLNSENFDEQVEKFIRTVDVLAIEYSCSVNSINGIMITTQSALIVYKDKEVDANE